MGFADFLVQAGGGSLSDIGRAFGGQSDRDKKMSDFVNNQLPVLRENVRSATTYADMEQAAKLMFQAAESVGVGPKSMKRLREETIAPALQGLNRREQEAILSKYGEQTTPLTPQVAAPEQGQPLAPSTTFEPQTRPGPGGPNFDLGFRSWMASGAKPETFKSMLEAPYEAKKIEEIAGGERAKRLQEESQYKAIEDLPETPIGETGMTLRSLMQASKGAAGGAYATANLPQRELPGASLDLKRQGLEIQQQRLQVLADRVAQGQATAAERLELQRLRLQLEQDKLDLQRRGTETTTEQPLEPSEAAIALANIAEEARNLGVTDAKGLKQIANRLDLELTGEPEIIKNSIFGGKGSRNIVGEGVTIRRRPRVVTRTPGGQPPAAQPAGPATQGGTVLMQAPDGSQRQVPADRVEEFKRKGARVIGR